MAEIEILNSLIFNRIAAGEVVDKPVSVVKELIENSIDAKASAISIDIKGGGIELIRIADNGKGIRKDELHAAILPHATSKIKDISDLDSIKTLGFRGEALASIGAVSTLTLVSRREGEDLGYFVKYKNGSLIDEGEIGCPLGTTVTVENIFENIPARKKFLRKPKTEEGEISDLVAKIIMSNNATSIKYAVENVVIYHSTGEGLENAILCVYGKDNLSNLLPLDSAMPDIALNGYASKPHFSKHNRTYQTVIVNGRIVQSEEISFALFLCYKEFLMSRQFPMFVLNINLPFDMVDVNVHPHKTQIKFIDFAKVKQFIMKSVAKIINDNALVAKEFISSEIASASTNASGSHNFISSNTHIDSIAEEDEPLNLTKSQFPKFIIKSNSSDLGESFKLKESTAFSQILNNSILQQGEPHRKAKLLQEESASFIRNEDVPCLIVGKAFNTYIIVQQNDLLYLIDQHAAHEKLIYDRYIDEINNHRLSQQSLLLPYIFDLTHSESNLLSDNLEAIQKLGFEISSLSSNSFSLHAVPTCFTSLSVEKFISFFMDSVKNCKSLKSDLLKEAISQSACKAAVKGEMDLSYKEVSHLLKLMAQSTTPLFCPHGRPIVIKISRNEIEKWFKRIV